MTREFLEGLGLDEETLKAILREAEKAEAEKVRLEGLLEEEKAKGREMKREFQVEEAVKAFGAKNAKAVRALLNLEGQEEDEDFSLSLREQLQRLKEENGFLFFGEEIPRIVGKSGKAGGNGFGFNFTGVR